MKGYIPYGDRRPYVVADTLAGLHGPTRGTVVLPHHLDWSGNAEYVLDRPARLAAMYRTVLNEALTQDDLGNWLDGTLLAQLWPSLWLPPKVRSLWEGRFPALADPRTGAAGQLSALATVVAAAVTWVGTDAGSRAASATTPTLASSPSTPATAAATPYAPACSSPTVDTTP